MTVRCECGWAGPARSAEDHDCGLPADVVSTSLKEAVAARQAAARWALLASLHAVPGSAAGAHKR